MGERREASQPASQPAGFGPWPHSATDLLEMNSLSCYIRCCRGGGMWSRFDKSRSSLVLQDGLVGGDRSHAEIRGPAHTQRTNEPFLDSKS